jgi:putative ABC transport system permease protein
MNVFFLALKSLWHRRMATGLTVIAIALSVALFIGVGKAREATRDAFSGAISRVDLIVGPRTGNLSLLLYSVFHVGYPSHNVSMKAVNFVKKNEQVSWVVPFSLGDGYRGFPVVGTTEDFFNHYKFRDGQSIDFLEGRGFQQNNEVVIGAEVASARGLKIGDKLILSHGHTEYGDGFEKHEEHPFTVVGLLKFTGTPIDRSLYVQLEGLAAIHQEPSSEVESPGLKSRADDKHATEKEHDHDHDHEHHDVHQHEDTAEQKHAGGHNNLHEHNDEHDHAHASFAVKDGRIIVNYVSGFFVGAKSRMSSLELQRLINTWDEEALLAIMPGVAMADLWKNLAIFETALFIISIFVVVAGMIGLFVSLLILSGQRQHEMIVLRAIGARPFTIFSLLAGEAMAIVFSAIMLGLGVMYVGLLVLSPWIEKKFAINLQLSAIGISDLMFAALLLLSGAIVGVLSSLRAYRIAMHDGLTTKY